MMYIYTWVIILHKPEDVIFKQVRMIQENKLDLSAQELRWNTNIAVVKKISKRKSPRE